MGRQRRRVTQIRSLSIGVIALCAACAESGDAGSGNAAGATAQVLAGKAVSAMTDRDIYTSGETGAATFVNRGAAPVFLPGCAPFVFEQSLDGVWTFAGPPFVCVWEGVAVDVGANQQVETAFDAPQETGFYRLRYEFSEGCSEGVPLSQANCASASTVHSAEFEVARELCDPSEMGCQFRPAAPNFLCDDGIHFGGPAADCTRDPSTGECGYEFLVCP